MRLDEFERIVKECVLEVLKERMLEGFDPSSQGPNAVCADNPYKKWNMDMRNKKEIPDPELATEDTHGRNAQESEAGEFDSRNFNIDQNN